MCSFGNGYSALCINLLEDELFQFCKHGLLGPRIHRDTHSHILIWLRDKARVQWVMTLILLHLAWKVTAMDLEAKCSFEKNYLELKNNSNFNKKFLCPYMVKGPLGIRMNRNSVSRSLWPWSKLEHKQSPLLFPQPQTIVRWLRNHEGHPLSKDRRAHIHYWIVVQSLTFSHRCLRCPWDPSSQDWWRSLEVLILLLPWLCWLARLRNCHDP